MADMQPSQILNRSEVAPHGGGSRLRFARHFGEMLVAMFAGMAVLGGAAELILSAAGSGFSDISGEAQVLLMGFNMTVPMVAWMSYRGHARARNVEMAASMIVPSLLAAMLAAIGALGAAGALGLQHVVVIPAMLAVMLWRYNEYSHSHLGEIGNQRPLGTEGQRSN